MAGFAHFAPSPTQGRKWRHFAGGQPHPKMERAQRESEDLHKLNLPQTHDKRTTMTPGPGPLFLPVPTPIANGPLFLNMSPPLNSSQAKEPKDVLHDIDLQQCSLEEGNSIQVRFTGNRPDSCIFPSHPSPSSPLTQPGSQVL